MATLIVSFPNGGNLVRVDPSPALVRAREVVTWVLPASDPDLRIEFVAVRDRTLGTPAVPTIPNGPFVGPLVTIRGQVSGTIRTFSEDPPPIHTFRFFYEILRGNQILDWENPVSDKLEGLGRNGGGIDVPARPPIT